MILALSMVLSILPVSAFADAGAASAANSDGETVYEENSVPFTVYVTSIYGTQTDYQTFEYAAGDSVEIPAPKREGYTFQNWVNGFGLPANTDLTQETIRFTMPASMVILRVETKLDVSVKYYILAVEGDNPKEEEHKEGDSIKITAPEKDGSNFSHWEVSGLPSSVVTTNQTITFDMPANTVILTPKYDELSAQKYFVFVDGGETEEHAAGEKVSIPAPKPKKGYAFSHWEADCELADADLKQETITFTMPAGNVNLTPKYDKCKYTLTVKNKNGEIIKEESYLRGDPVEANAPEVAGSTFIRWEAEGLPEKEDRPTDFFTNSKISFFMPENNVTLTLVYAKKHTLTLTGGKTEQHFEGQTVTVIAPEQPGFTFNGWKTLPEGAVVDGKTVTFTMPDHDVTVEADLIPTPAPEPDPVRTFTLTVKNAQVTLQNGADVDLTAVPVDTKLVVTADEKEGFTFNGWKTEGLPKEAVIDGKTITFEMPDNDVTIEAKIEKIVTKTLKIDKATVTLQDGSEVADLNAVPVGTKLVVNADADTDTSVFKGWNCTGMELTKEQSTARELKFDMPDQDVELTAVFEAPVTPDPDPEPTPDPDPAPAPSDDGSAAVIVAATVAGGAAVGVGAYMVGTTVYLKSVLPEGVAIPANRQQLAVALWTAAGKPATQSTALFNDVAADSAELQAIRWAVDTGLMTAQDGSFKPGSRVSRWEVIRTWKSYQKRG